MAHFRRIPPANSIGLTQIVVLDYDSGDTTDIEQQLAKAGVPYERADIPHLGGMGGQAWLIFYTSTKTGKSITVLCVPVRSDVDAFSVDHFYFEGKSRDEAMSSEQWWLNAYDECVRLNRVAKPA